MFRTIFRRCLGLLSLAIWLGALASGQAATVVVGWGNNNGGQLTVPASLTNVVAVGGGNAHSLALRADGRVVAWGSNEVGQTNVPPGLSDAVAIATGADFNLALRANGTVVAWGDGTYGQTNVPVSATNVVAIAAATYFGLALRGDGTVVEWGYGYPDQPRVPAELHDVVAIAAAGAYSLALKRDGSIVAWGYAESYQKEVPAEATNIVALAAGMSQALGVRTDGTVLAWGWASRNGADVPESATNVVAAALGYSRGLALRSDGTVVNWGEGELFIQTPGGSQIPLPNHQAMPDNLTNVVAIAVGSDHSLTVVGDSKPVSPPPLTNWRVYSGQPVTLHASAVGTLPLQYQWQYQEADIPDATNAVLTLPATTGKSGDYAVTVSNVKGSVTAPVAHVTVLDSAPILTDQSSSSAPFPGATIAFAVGATGSEPLGYQWKFNGTAIPDATNANFIIDVLALEQFGAYTVTVSNQFGVVTSTNAVLALRPVLWRQSGVQVTEAATNLNGAVAVSAQGNHFLALRPNGTVLDLDYYGQLREGVPAELTNAVAVAAGDYHNLALRTDGTVLAWGTDYSGEFDGPVGLNQVVAIAAGYSHSLALKSDGTVVQWGYTGGYPAPAGLTNVVAIAAGGYRGYALVGNGTVVGWGGFTSEVSDDWTNVVAIAAGDYNLLALRADGTVMTTGGQYQVPPEATNVVAIAAGGNTSLVLRADGTVVTWGYNYYYGGNARAPEGLTNVVAITVGDSFSVALFGSGPKLLSVPMKRTAYTGQTVPLRANVVGALPIVYQWFYNGDPIADATNALFELTGLVQAHSGIYSVTASNRFGQVSGVINELTVVDSPPSVVRPPASMTSYLGGSGIFKVRADGSQPLGYQWLLNGHEIAGATNAEFSVTRVSLQAIGEYSVRITNGFGAITSAVATLTAEPVIGWGGYGNTFAPFGTTNLVAIAGGDNHVTAITGEGKIVVTGYERAGEPQVPAGLTEVVALAEGTGHSLALKADGTVVAWGYNDWGQANVPGGLTNVVAIAAGAGHCLALTGEGRVVAWGRNEYGQVTVPESARDVASISARGSWSVAVRGDGTVVAWGNNEAGQLNIPFGLTEVVAVAAGTFHGAALKRDGTVVVWGDNSQGQTNVTVELKGVVAISGGDYHTLLLREDGTMLSIGNPPPLEGLTNVTAMAAGGNLGGDYGLALAGVQAPFLQTPMAYRSTFTGKTIAFRAAATGSQPLFYQWQEDGRDITDATNAMLVMAGADAGTRAYSVTVHNDYGSVTRMMAQVTTVAAAPNIFVPPENLETYWGGQVSMRVFADGSGPMTYQWRMNGVPIAGATNNALNFPSARGGQSGWYSVAVSNSLGGLLSPSASLRVSPLTAWGIYSFVLAPESLSNAVAVAAGAFHELVLLRDGTAWDWLVSQGTGLAFTNVVAIATSTYQDVGLRQDGTVVVSGGYYLEPPAGLSNVVAIATGNDYNFALRSDGTVTGWGYDNGGHRVVPAGLGEVVAIAVGGLHTLALKADGTVVAWGYNYYGQTNVPAGLSDVVAIAAGDNFSLALKRDGTVVGWGDDDYGYYAVPADLTGVVGIAAGDLHRLALKRDGTVVGWGNGTYGNTRIPPGLTNVTAISAGGYDLALSSDAAPQVTMVMNNRAAYSGEPVLLTAQVSGRVTSYQWQYNGENIDGATGPFLRVTNATTGTSGNYRLMAGNAAGVTTGAVVTVSVTDAPPQLVVAPMDRATYFSGSNNLVVIANGSRPLGFQWRFNNADLPDATNATLVFPNARLDQSGLYSVRVTNAFGAITTANVTFTVKPVVVWGGSSQVLNVPLTLTNVMAVADAGHLRALALRRDGKVTAWGSTVPVPGGLSNVVAIAGGTDGGGSDFSLALRSNGTVFAWGAGADYDGVTIVPGALTNAVAVSAGGGHVLSLTADGRVIAWGDNLHAQTTVPANLRDVVAIAAGYSHSVALTGGGRVVAWGDGTGDALKVPAGLSNVVAIAAGNYFTMALKADGQVVAWGFDYYGIPNVPEGLSNVVAIAAGQYHALALTAEGTVFAWGLNNDGDTEVPAGLASVGAISARNHSVAVAAAGAPVLPAPPMTRTIPSGRPLRLYARGFGAIPLSYQWQKDGADLPGATNAWFAINNSATTDSGDYALVVGNARGSVTGLVAQVAVLNFPPTITVQPTNTATYPGGPASFEVQTDGTAPLSYRWVHNGQLSGDDQPRLNLAGVWTNDVGQYAVVVSNAFGAVTSSIVNLNLRTLVAWGENYFGQTNTPLSLTNVAAIAAGRYNGLALDTGGRLTAWGDDYGSLASLPAWTANLVAVSAAENHYLALQSDGRVIRWDRRFYSSEVPAALTNIVEISAGESCDLALKADGTVIAWGYNIYGQTNVPAGLKNVVAIAAGPYHDLALKADGTVVAWGSDYNGVTAVPAGLSNVVAIAAADEYSLALTADGRVVGWGYFYYGDDQFFGSITNAVAISTRGNHMLILMADGTVMGLGRNFNGQSGVPPGLEHVSAIAAGTDFSLALAGAAPPVVLGSTLGRTNYTGQYLNLKATVAGARPVTYQWRLNGNLIIGATNASLVLTNLALGNTGAYSLLVSNLYGTATSTVADLAVIEGPPVVVIGPVAQSTYPGGTAEFSVLADGSFPLRYQWRFNGFNIPRSTNATLTLNSVRLDQAGQYSVVVSNAFGGVASLPAALTLKPVVGWGANYYGTFDTPVNLTNVVAIAAGANHELALQGDGRVIPWGGNNDQQTNVPAGVFPAVAIASGLGHSLALKADGRVLAWGINAHGQAEVPTGLSNVVAITAGADNSYALRGDGSVVAWGSSLNGRTQVPAGASNVVAIAAGWAHCLALRADGTVVAWGQNYNGQVEVPPGLSNVVAIAAGSYHSLALLVDGTVVGWGESSYHQTVSPEGLDHVVAIAAGDGYSTALKSNGTVVSWGSEYYGQPFVPAGLRNVVGIAAGRYHQLALTGYGAPLLMTPAASLTAYVGRPLTLRANTAGMPRLSYQWRINGAPIGGATNAFLHLNTVDFSDAGTYTVAVSNAVNSIIGTVARVTVVGAPPLIVRQPSSQASGFHGAARFNVGVEGSPPFGFQWRFNDAPIAGATNDALLLTDITPEMQGRYSVTVSNQFGVVTSSNAMLTTSVLVAWGDNQYGQTAVPPDLTNIVAISAGGFHAVALRNNGTVIAWGYNESGRTNVPPGLDQVIAVSGGGYHSLALRRDGTVVGWGDAHSHQTNVPPGLSHVVAISAGGRHSLALLDDGTIRGWGENVYGQTGGAVDQYNVIAISAGYEHSLALQKDGTVVGWGRNLSNQTTVPYGLTGVVAISAGAEHSLALKSNGTVAAWGANGEGQCNVPPGLNEVVAISAGGYHSVALKRDGSVVAWGANDVGQVTTAATLQGVVAISAGYFFNLALPGNAPFLVVDSPVNVQRFSGQAIELKAQTAGGLIFQYQWQRNGENIVGATNAWLQLSGLSTDLSGQYTVMVSNVLGSNIGVVARLQVADSGPLIVVPPVNQRVYRGGWATFTVAGDGSYPLSYQWRSNGVAIPNATATNLVVRNLPPFSQALYSVMVSNQFGSVFSGDVRLQPSAAVAWGYNLDGQTNVPGALINVASVGAGTYHVVAAAGGGPVFTWGDNRLGQGNFPAGLGNIRKVAAGYGYSVAQKDDGTVVAWGSGDLATTNVPPGLDQVVAIAAGQAHSLALQRDGTVRAWGDNSSGQIAIPAGLTDVVAVAAGSLHSLALKADGTVIGWGSQGPPPGGLANVVAISGGGSHSLALRGDGTVVAWGGNAVGQALVPAGLSNVVGIAAGGAHSLALKGDGTVVAWGYNSSGQNNVPAGLTNAVAIAAGGAYSLAVVEAEVTLAVTTTGSLHDRRFSVAVPTERGRNYFLRYKNLLGEDRWTLLPPVPGDGTVKNLADPAASGPIRFYQVWEQ